jgi:glucosyl-3-phosphoglycerate phosphatase
VADAVAKRLVLLRHGRTQWNHVGRAQGHADVPLDELGRAQAAAVAPLIARLRPARIWSSDLSRAAQTAAAVAEACGVPVEEDKRLREFSVGERQGLTWSQSVDRFPWIAERVGLGERFTGVPGAESDDDVRRRMVPALEELADLLDGGETGVVVSHGAATAVSLAAFLGWHESVLRTISVLGNCQWTTVLVPASGGTRRLLNYGMGDFASREGIG